MNKREALAKLNRQVNEQDWCPMVLIRCYGADRVLTRRVRTTATRASCVAPGRTGKFAVDPASTFVPSGGLAFASTMLPGGAERLGQGVPFVLPAVPPR
jgi:hypothetical protein